MSRDYDRDDRDYDRDDDRPRRRDRDDGPDDVIAEAKRKVKAPAICLLVVGVVYLLAVIVSVVISLTTFDQQMEQAMAQQKAQQQGNAQAAQASEQMMKDMMPVIKVMTVVIAAVFALLAALVIFGATRMLSLSSRGWGMAACIIAFVPMSCYVWLFGLAFGIWGLVVLNNPEVRRGFDLKRKGGSAERGDDDDRRDRDRDDDRRD